MDSEYTASGHHVDYARKIRNEGNRDGMPSKSDVEAEVRKDELVHAEWKAVKAVCDSLELGTHHRVVHMVAKVLGFERLERELSTSYKDFKGFRAHHMESHEKPTIPEGYQGQLPEYAMMPSFSVNDRVRSLKADAFRKLHEQAWRGLRLSSMSIAPFGMSLAVVAVYKGEVFTNETWDAVFGDEKWSDRISEEKKNEYRNKLDERLSTIRGDR